MDALKLFYEQQLEARQRRSRDRGGKAVAPPEAAAVERGPERDSRPATAPCAFEGTAPPERDGSIDDAPGATNPEDTAERLLHHVEQHAGQPLRTRASIDAYFAAQSRLRDDDRPPKRSLLRETVLVLFLAVAVLQYYYIDVSLQIAALNQVTVFVPVQASPPRDDGA
ncbi:MAG TPA: hypothetical protein VLA41_05630 [Burkholderiales bacterium]|nr:hypothetical protein [Burkholderiales bacterium]